MQQINQPHDMDKGVEIHALPYGSEGGHRVQLTCRMKDMTQVFEAITKPKSRDRGREL